MWFFWYALDVLYCSVFPPNRTQRVGDKTPADLILFAGTDLKIDNSSLTGESEPQDRGPLPNGSQARTVEAENLVFNSTLVVNGEAWGGK